MADTKWAISLYSSDDITKPIMIVSNFKSNNLRANDDLLIFRGMYECEDYLVWYIHKNLPMLDLSRYSIELKLYLDGSPKKPFFREKYRIISVRYNTDKDKFEVYCVQEDYFKIILPFWKYNVSSLDWKDLRTPAEVLTEVLENNNIISILYQPSLGVVSHNYSSLPIDLMMRPVDLINYICQDNSWEWTIKYGMLIFGPELNAIQQARSFRKGEDMADNMAETPYFRYSKTATMPADVLCHIREEYRSIWVRHNVGSMGGITEVCWSRIGDGSVPKELYWRSLKPGSIERSILSSNLSKVGYNESRICKILSDDGITEYLDLVATDRKVSNLAEDSPRKFIFDDDESISFIRKASRTTPYLDNGRGILFPSVDTSSDGHVVPNSLMFSPKGRVESSVVGPFVIGSPDENFKIPAKNANDFRLQLPSDFCLYVKENGDMVLQNTNLDSQSIPVELGNHARGMHFLADNGNGEQELKLALGDGGEISLTSGESGTCSILADAAVKILGGNKSGLSPRYVNIMAVDGDVTIGGDGINFQAIAGNITVIASDSGKKIILSSNGDITIDSSAGSVLIQGGAKALAHANHTHQFSHIHTIGNMGMPTNNPVPTSTNPCTDNTIKTKAD